MRISFFKKIIASILVIIFIIPVGFFIAPKKAEAGACSFGSGSGGGGDSGSPDAMIIFNVDLEDLKFKPFVGKESFELAVFGGDIFSKDFHNASIPQTEFIISEEYNSGMRLAIVGDASSFWQIVQVGIEGVTKAISCITSIASAIGAFATNSIATKEFLLDGIAWALMNIIITDMLNDIQRWAVSGFQGEPVFITNIEQYFSDLADDVVGAFLNELAGVNLCSVRWKPLIEIALDINLGYRQHAECTLTEIVGNFDKYIEDFTTGGWEAWIELTTKPQNTPNGAYLKAVEKVAQGIGTVPSGILDRETQKLGWGKGFISIHKCKFGTTDVDGREVCTDTKGELAPDEYDIVSPGSMLEEYVNGSNNTGTNRLIVADELNETIVAILYGLVVKTFSSDDGYLGSDYSKLSAAIGKSPGNSAFADVKNGFLADVDGFRLSEKGYRAAKLEQLGIVSTSKTILENLIICRQNELVLYDQYQKEQFLSGIEEGNPFIGFDTESAIASATNTQTIIDTRITPRFEPLTSDVRQSEEFSKEIDLFYAETNKAESFQELDELTRFFFETRNRWHNPIDTATAEEETNFISDEFKQITAQAESDLAACSIKRQDMRDFLNSNGIKPKA